MKLCVDQLGGRTKTEGRCHLKSQIAQVLGLAILVETTSLHKTLLFP